MTYTRRGATAEVGVGSNTFATTDIPATVQPGDFLIATYTTTATVFSGNPLITGWTRRGTTNADGTSNMAQWIYTRTAQSGDAGSAVAVTGTGATRQQMTCVAYYDDTGIPLDFEDFIGDLDLTLPNKNTVAANCFGVAGAGIRNTGVETWTPPGGWTEVIEGKTDNGTGGKSSEVIEKLTPVASGTNLGGLTFVPSAGTNAGCWLVIVKPVPVVATNPGAFLPFM